LGGPGAPRSGLGIEAGKSAEFADVFHAAEIFVRANVRACR
jgi:hypothetical protein